MDGNSIGNKCLVLEIYSSQPKKTMPCFFTCETYSRGLAYLGNFSPESLSGIKEKYGSLNVILDVPCSRNGKRMSRGIEMLMGVYIKCNCPNCRDKIAKKPKIPEL